MTRSLFPAVVALVMAAGFGLAHDPGSFREAARNDLKALQGTWVLVEMESDGERVAPEGLEGRSARYEGDALTLLKGGEVHRRAVVTLDPGRTPRAINTWDADGPYEDETVPGIYELAGDTVKFCFARPGENRPAKFSTTKGTGFLYVVYRRKKPNGS